MSVTGETYSKVVVSAYVHGGMGGHRDSINDTWGSLSQYECPGI